MLGLPAFHFPQHDDTRRAWPKAILFDLDDTLWPIAPVILQAEESLFAWLREHAPRVAERFTIDSLRQARLELLARKPEFQLDLGKLRRAGLLDAFEQAGEDAGQGRTRDDPVLRRAQCRGALRRRGARPAAPEATGCWSASITNGNADLRTIGLSHHFKVSVAAPELGVAKPDAGDLPGRLPRARAWRRRTRCTSATTCCSTCRAPSAPACARCG